jgi:peptidoglycan/xylan/chitin deacetylase (PgdA/CDA1 family)
MKAIMYHYVREPMERLPNFRYLHVDNFRKQLDFFESQGGFVSRDEWSDFVTFGTIPKLAGKHLLTFDDAMSCHFDYVYPELVRRGLWGIFYVPAKPYTANIVLNVHRVHLLCGAFDGLELLALAKSIVTEDMVFSERREEFSKFTYTTQKNLSGVSEFKRLINYFAREEMRTEILQQISTRLNYNSSPDGFYVSEAGIKTMSDNGMLIGSHTMSHPVMSKLSRELQKDEIERSFEFLSGLCRSSHKTYCHPYGGFHSFDQNTIELLRSVGVDFSFNVEPRDIEAVDHANSIQFLPRYDCNLFTHGKAS